MQINKLRVVIVATLAAALTITIVVGFFASYFYIQYVLCSYLTDVNLGQFLCCAICTLVFHAVAKILFPKTVKEINNIV